MIQEWLSCQKQKKQIQYWGAAMINECIKNVDELVLSIHAAVRHTGHLAFNPLEETIGFSDFTNVLLNGQVKRAVVQRRRMFMCGEWIDESDRSEWVILNSGSGRRSNSAKLNRDKET